MMERVGEAANALLDEAVRQHRQITNDRLEETIEKHALNSDESLALHERLGEEGVAITFEQAREEPLSTDAFARAQEAEADRAISRDLVRTCLAGIAARPLLTLDDEVALARRIGEARGLEQALATGGLARTPEVVRTLEEGLAAKQRLVMAHLRLVLSIARRYRQRADEDLLDLVQEGAAGLMRAAEKFDPDRGVRFSTYAVWWVREAIRQAVAGGGHFMRIPMHVADQIRRLRAVEREFREANDGQEPTTAQVAESLGWNMQRTAMVSALAHSTVVSLDSPLPGSEQLTLGETLESEEPTPEQLYAQMQVVMLLGKAVETLSDRERAVITRRFGLKKRGEEEMLEQISQSFGVSRERARQIQERAIDKLRLRLRAMAVREPV